jgi:hypothetical protein
MATDQFKGQVSGFQQRVEPSGGKTVLVWDFRLERHDEAKHPLPRMAVEMRGPAFEGSISNGDIVEVEGHLGSSNVLHANRLRNLSTNATVSARGIVTRRISTFVFLLIFVVVAGFILSVVLKIFGTLK